MKKIVTIIGARPQFIKAAVLSMSLRGRYDEILVHTGQHFDSNMSDIFFQELEISAPRYNLGISGGSHAEMTGAMLIGIEKVLLQETPDAVLIYGDTNSTLAAVIAAVKLRIPVFHVEAGNRLGTLDNPEEANRITADHLSSLLFACTESSMNFLQRENLGSRAIYTGDIMYDAFCFFSKRSARKIPDENGNLMELPRDFCYMTCHRAENTNDDRPLLEIFRALDSLGYPVIYPVHPRNRERAQRLQKTQNFRNLRLIPPVGYLESLSLTKHAKVIVTDSGGLQREAFFAGIPCITIFDHVVWPETLYGNRNQMCRPNADEILQKLAVKQQIEPSFQPFGDGHACERIVAAIDQWFQEKMCNE